LTQPEACDSRRTIRISFLCLTLLVACPSAGSGERAETGAAGVGTGAAKPAEAVKPPTGPAPKIVWTDTNGEILVASDGETLTSACGLTGKLTPTEVTLAGDTQPWGVLVRDGRRYSRPLLDGVIEVSPQGMVTHKVGSAETPLGEVTGLTGDAELQWFGALVVAAPMVKHELALTSIDGTFKLSLTGAADMRAWEVKRGATPIAVRRRAEPRPLSQDAPAFPTDLVTVSIDSPGHYLLQVVRDTDAIKAAFPRETTRLNESADGTKLELMAIVNGKPLKPRPFATLVGRQKCRAHDEAVAALIWSFVASKSGHDVAM